MSKVVFCNNDITDIKYSGFTISKVYACGGQLVYEKEPVIVCDDYKLTYKDATGYKHSIAYNGNYTVTIYDTNITECNEGTPYHNFTIGKCVKKIEKCALRGSGRLSIPSGVTYIGEKALSDRGTSTTTFEGVNPPILDATALSGSTGAIYVPCEALERYKNAYPSYADRITASTTSCTQLPIYDDDGSYNYIYSDSTHIGSVELPDVSSLTSPKVEIDFYKETQSHGIFLIDEANGLDIRINTGSLYAYINGKYRATFSRCSNNEIGTIQINPDGWIWICGEGIRPSLSSSVDLTLFGNNDVECKIKEVRIYDGATLVYQLIPMLYCGKAAMFDVLNHNLYMAKGNLGCSDN